MRYHEYYSSPLGRLHIAVEDEELVSLEAIKDNEKEFETARSPVLEKVKRYLDSYFSGQNPERDFALRLEGSSFQKEVWDILLTIPYGKTTSYGEIANRIAERRGLRKMSSQAVGGAVGANPIMIIVPCHRVIGKTGRLVGFGPGLDKKKILLRLENIRIENEKVVLT